MSLQNNYKIKKIANSYVLYDANIIAEPTLQLFDRDYHTKRLASQKKSVAAKVGIGRAAVCYLSINNHAMVLKHYFRGGLIASLTKDCYLGRDVENSRAFRECRLLIQMFELGLPVPLPVAAHVKKGMFCYRADLITQEIKQAATLADVLSDTSITAEQWKKIGHCIKLFHQHNVYHADLNARNILLTGSSSATADVYLIDFDNSEIRAGGENWKQKNLARLQRSLLKFKKNKNNFHFDDASWLALLDGYQ